MKKITVLTGSIALTLASYTLHARHVAVGDIVARDLLIDHFGWLGHVGMVTGSNIEGSSSLIIEAMRDGPPSQKIVFNNIDIFKHQSPYWGSRYGIGTKQSAYNALIEMNHQRWWCPGYTPMSIFKVGSGNIKTGQVFECGEWRCDTMIEWGFTATGHPGFPLTLILPKFLFNKFPLINHELLENKDIVQPPLLNHTDKVFSELSAEELNNMPLEEFEMVADIPLNQETPTHIVSEWKYANNPKVNEVKRSVFIDRLSMTHEQDVIPRFIKMYGEADSDEIKRRLIQGTMVYYQSHRKQIKGTHDAELLRAFYKKLLIEGMPSETSQNVVRGFIFFYSTDEIIENKALVDNQFETMDHFSLLSLKWELSHKSQKLETLYFPSIIEMLRKDNSSNLNEMFFGLSKMGWRHFRNKESVDLIRNYVKDSAVKYEGEKHSVADMNDPYFTPAIYTYNDLKNDLDKEFSK